MRVPAPTLRGFLPTSARGPLSAPAPVFDPARDTANEDSQHPFQAFRLEPAPPPVLRHAVCSAVPLRRAAKTPAPHAGDARNELVVRGRPLDPRSLLRRPHEGSSRPSFHVPRRPRGILSYIPRGAPSLLLSHVFRSSLERRFAEQPGVWLTSQRSPPRVPRTGFRGSPFVCFAARAARGISGLAIRGELLLRAAQRWGHERSVRPAETGPRAFLPQLCAVFRRILKAARCRLRRPFFFAPARDTAKK